MMEAQSLFTNLRVNIKPEGRKYLGAVIGSTEHRDKYGKDLVKTLGHTEHRDKYGKDLVKTLGQTTYHFVNYYRNKTASSLFSICQWV